MMQVVYRNIVVFLLAVASGYAQVSPLYVSKQTGEKSEYNGSGGKTTDKYETGNIVPTTTGPISYSLDPNSLSIGTNETKNWIGKVFPDVASAPAPGDTAPASLTGAYTVKYSRPAGTGSSASVLSTHSCYPSVANPCPAHGSVSGTHEIVQKTGNVKLDFMVYSIKVDLPDTICLPRPAPGTAFSIGTSTAVSSPAAGGTYQWTSLSAALSITAGGNTATATLKLSDTTATTAKVQVKYTISGVSYTDQAVIKICSCFCKPINGGISVGPVTLAFNSPPVSTSPDANGFCEFNVANAKMDLSMNGVLIRNAQFNSDVKVNFKKHCQTGQLTDVTISWKAGAGGGVQIADITINGVQFLQVKVTQFSLTVSPAGQLNGTVTINSGLPQDKDLSYNKGIMILKQGVNGDIIFTFAGGNSWAGSWNFGGVKNINIDIVKKDGANGVTIAQFKNGSLDAAGTLLGQFVAVGGASYTTNLFKVTMGTLTLDLSINIPNAAFKVLSGSGSVTVSDMKGVKGTVELALAFNQGNCNGTVSALNITAFSMTLDEFVLSVDFNGDFDMTYVKGKLKAQHDQFDAKIKISNFEIKDHKLIAFSGSGKVAYKFFSFDLQNISYSGTLLSISAEVTITATGAGANFAVDKFTIDDNGTIAIYKIGGSLNKTPVQASFSATFNNSEFAGSFSASFTSIGLDGNIVIGAKPAFNYAYFDLTAKTNIVLGQSGLKLSKLSGRIGYNYQLQFSGGTCTGNPSQGSYLIALGLGVADVADMCEVAGEVVVQLNPGAVVLTLNGNINVLKNNTFFNGYVQVNYQIPDKIWGSVGSVIKVPASGWVFTSSNLNVNFSIMNNHLKANGSNMGGTMFNKINFTQGAISLDCILSSPSSITGSLSGKANANLGYTVNWSNSMVAVTGGIDIKMNSDISANINENGLAGSFTADVVGEGNVNYNMTIWPNLSGGTWVSGSSTATVTVGGASSASVSGNVSLQLPISLNLYWISWNGIINLPFSVSI